jgi:hypothetical protein
MPEILDELKKLAATIKPMRRVRTSAFIPRGKCYEYDGPSFDPLAEVLALKLDGTAERAHVSEFWCNEEDWDEAVRSARGEP